MFAKVFRILMCLVLAGTLVKGAAGVTYRMATESNKAPVEETQESANSADAMICRGRWARWQWPGLRFSGHWMRSPAQARMQFSSPCRAAPPLGDKVPAGLNVRLLT